MQTSNSTTSWLTWVCAVGCGLLVMLPGLALAHAPHVETEQIQLAGEHPDQAALEAAFAEAAVEYGVPEAILKAVGFVESRWVHAGPTVDYGYGIMHLVNNSDSQTLIDAAKLTGYTVDELITDPIANIRGGAAVIAKYAADTVGQPQTLEDYWEALKLFSGLNPEVQAKQAHTYYLVLAEGAGADNNLGMQIDLPAESIDLSLVGPEDDGLAVQSEDYGPAIWNPAASCNYETSRGGTAIDRWINHWVGSGSYAGTISWFKNCAASTSSHFVIRQSDGEITQMVRIAHKAWTTGYMNSRSIGVEHEATPSYPWPQSPSAPMIVASATACRHFCNVYGIPKTRTYITGHSDYYSTSCPGNLPWDVYLAVVNGNTYTNPPYLFGGGNDGWTAGNSASGIAHTGSDWGGSIYFDQTGNDCYIYSPTTNIGGPYAPQVFNVDFYPQGGTTAAHDMQLFWKTNASNSFTADKSSPMVYYNAQNAYVTTNLSVDKSPWWGQTINQLRLDFDQTNRSTRYIINHVVLQDAFWWHFSSDTMGWTAGNSLTATWHTGSATWRGALVTDQTGNDAYMYSPNITGGGWPYNYIGGVNDWIVVAVYPQSGNSAVHDMRVYWTHAGDGTWTDAKSTLVTYTGQNEWVTVRLPVGLNSAWERKHITRLRLDFDHSNHGTRWIVDYIRSLYDGADTTAPSTPTNLAATLTSDKKVNLAWTASTDAMGVNGYRIYRNGAQIATSVAASYTDTGTSAGATYSYRVAAYDASGNVSTQSAAASIDVPTDDTVPPTVPTGLTGNATGPTTVQLSWNASTDNVGVTGYDIRRDGATIGSSTGTSYTDNAATANTTHSYQVRAKDAGLNYSGWSTAASVTTPPTPPVPTVVFSDGFNGNLNNWTQGDSAFAYSTTANRGGLTGAGAAFIAAGEADQMYKTFARPFAQGVASGYFWDGMGGWKAGTCGWQYRQTLSLREPGGSASFMLDNCFAQNVGAGEYYYRYLCCGWASTYTAIGARDANTDCNGTWVHFETTITPGAPGANPGGSILLKATDRAGAKSASPALDPDFFNWGIGRITLGFGVTSLNEGYWDDISFTATPPGVPTMGSPSAPSATQITWNFSRADNNFFGWDVATGGGTIVSPQYPAGGWLDRNATSWTEAGLTPNTEYSRKVRAWNGTLNGDYSDETKAYTLSPAPSAASATADEDTVCVGDPVTWTAVGGFGAGKVEYYEYAWNQNATHAFTGSEPVWSSGPLELTASATGTWYLHVRGFNADDVANGTYSYAATCVACAPPAITSAVSRKSHGGAGDFDLDVSVPTAVEGRSNGPTELIVGFDAEIQGVGGLDTADVSLSYGSVTQVGIVNGDELHVELSGVTNGTPLQVSFPGISDTGGQAVVDTLCFRVLAGDVNSDGQVNVLDLVAVRNGLNQAAAAGTFTRDVTTDGTINVLDLVAVRNALNQSVPVCP